MAATKRNRWKRLMCWGLGFAAAGAAWAGAGWAGAQPFEAPKAAEALPSKSYMNKATFYLPVTLDDRSRAGLQEIQLYAKQDPSQPWTLKEKIAPNQNCFSFKAPQDGEYWFTVVTVDKAGRMTPSDFANEGPGVIVVLDTQAPQLDVSALPPSPEGAMIKVDLRDTHLDASKTQFYFQTGDKMWRPLTAIPKHPDQFCIPRQAVLTGMIKVVAGDMANNVVTREYNLSSLPMAGTQVTHLPATGPSLEPAAGAISPIPRVDHRSMQPIGGSDKLVPVVHSTSPVPEHKVDRHGSYVIHPNPARPHEVRGPDSVAVKNPGPLSPFPAASNQGPQLTHPGARTTEPPIANKQIVNNTHVFLDYQIEQMGASGVGKVEVWLTIDQGKSWRKHCEDIDRKSPIEVDLPGEGLYGLTLVVSNGRGFGATPPSAGDAPDWWIEVDLTRPLTELTSVRPGSADEAGALHICWSARDKNMGLNPIDLFYAIKKDGPWQPIAKGLRNEGHYRWAVPGDLGPHAYIRMVTTDQAGNTAQADTAQPVALDDLSRPRGRVVGISTGVSRITLEGER